MAASRAQCQKFLTEFRVAELKELLKAVSLSTRGRKCDLFQRANDLLSHGSPKIQMHIRDIYFKTHYPKRHTTPMKSGKMPSTLPYSHMKDMMQHHTPKSHHFNSTRNGEGSYILHPDVTFKPLPFYELIETIIRPTTLVSTAMTSSGSSSMQLQFHLSPQQVKLICAAKTQGRYGKQLLLRFARKESSCEQEDFYPKQCFVKVNSNYCTLPGYNPHLSLRPDYKRLGSPVNITGSVRLSASQRNDLLFYWINDILYPQGFCVELVLVTSLSSSDLLQDLKAKGIRSPEVSRALVREKLAIDRDSEISATSLRVSLLCPLGKLRMTHPCRSQMCTHLQCFDASIFLQMNERKARWVCPVCDKPASADSLVIDGLFKEICAESSSNDIEFFSDGSWHPINTKEGPTHSLSPERKLVSLDSVSPVTIVDSMDTSNSAKGEGTISDPIVIDLSSDEDDDDDEGPFSSSQPLPSSSSSTPHIVNPSSSSRSHPSPSSSPDSSFSAREDSLDYVCRDGPARSVVVKRRYSSTTDGGTEAILDPCMPQSTTVTTTSTSASQSITTPVPVPVITEYAPTLPYFRPLLPYLAQPSVRTILASSADPLTSSIGVSGISGVSGGDVNLDELQHLYTLSEF